MDQPEGNWKPVPGWESQYKVSFEGLVWSIPRSHVRGGLLKPVPRPSGYLYVCFYRDKKPVWRTVHSIVAEAFHGERPEGEEVRHYPDPDKLNNRADNLVYGTSGRNKLDLVEHGGHHGANKVNCVKHGTPLEMKPDGSQRFCRKCSNESTSRYYHRNKDRAMQWQRDRRAREREGGEANAEPV